MSKLDELIKQRDTIHNEIIELEKYQNKLVNFCNLNKTKLYVKGNVSTMSYVGNYQLKRIYDFLYKDSSIFLTRKKDIFEKVLNQEKYK